MKYEIKGGSLPVVICTLDAGEKMITEGGAMSWMTPNMKMETSSNGGVSKALGRMFTGESIFQNIYTAENGPGMIAFASSFPGSIIPFEINNGKDIIFQKRTFLAGTAGIQLSTHVNKSAKTGLFGGEGFIMQKISGQGIVFGEFDGHVIQYQLGEGQQLVLDTGHLAAMDSTCSITASTVKGAKNIFLGGEGLFNTIVTGPGRIWLQTMPMFGLMTAASSSGD